MEEHSFTENILCTDLSCSFLCIHFLIVVSVVLSICFVTLIPLARFMVVFYPLDSRFKYPEFVRKLVLSVTFVVWLISSGFTTLMKFFHTNKDTLWLCIPVGHKGWFLTGFTALLIVLGIVTGLAVPALYACVLYLLSRRRPSIQKKHLGPETIVNSFVAVVSHVVSWLPTSFVLISVLVEKQEDHNVLLAWTLFTLVPVNLFIYPWLLRKKKE